MPFTETFRQVWSSESVNNLGLIPPSALLPSNRSNMDPKSFSRLVFVSSFSLKWFAFKIFQTLLCVVVALFGRHYTLFRSWDIFLVLLLVVFSIFLLGLQSNWHLQGHMATFGDVWISEYSRVLVEPPTHRRSAAYLLGK